MLLIGGIGATVEPFHAASNVGWFVDGAAQAVVGCDDSQYSDENQRGDAEVPSRFGLHSGFSAHSATDAAPQVSISSEGREVLVRGVFWHRLVENASHIADYPSIHAPTESVCASEAVCP